MINESSTLMSHNILLDHKFNAKISDFGLAKLCSNEQSAVSMTAARRITGYIAPEVFSRNFGNVSDKSDIYSFEMLLLEIVGVRLNKIKKEDQLKILKFLEDYKALKPARYSYTDIKKITNRFQNKVGQGGYGSVYKGNLSNDVHVAVKILNNVKGNEKEFINEVQTIGRIHHITIVHLVGHCSDGFRRALLYEFLSNNSLEKFISSLIERSVHLVGRSCKI
ncbi:rust resistance kinase Lr10-like [Camellia sinensis]|uniref:rust resistance kinase Lr10-like n=1 Tax=Camellia sinensis TaxID=4442 RepID=UPI001036CF3F|nr:rust resistance kinase Lr10-like [Camellia sinensis]